MSTIAQRRAAAFKTLTNQVRTLANAMLAIKSHVEVSMPSGYRLSTVWNIATNAMNDAGKL